METDGTVKTDGAPAAGDDGTTGKPANQETQETTKTPGAGDDGTTGKPAKQETQETAETEKARQAAPDGKKSGDPAKALSVERRRLKTENARLRSELERLALPAKPEPLKQIEGMKPEDLLDGKQVIALLQEQQHGIMESVQQMLQNRSRIDTVLEEIESWEIYQDEAVGEAARALLQTRLADAKSLDEASQMIEAVAKQMSGLVVERETVAAQRGTDGARTLRQSTGSETATHIKLEKPPQSFDEAAARALRDGPGILKRIKAAMGS